MNAENRIFLIDLMPIIYRGYFVFLKNPRRTATGINTSPLGVLANTVVQILRDYQPTHIAFAAESSTPTFRHQLYAPYKAQREKAPEDIVASIPMATELANAMGIPVISIDGYEADDVLGTLADRAAREGFEVFIASPDKDLGQLVGPNITLYKPGGQAEVLGPAEICKQWGLQSPDQMLDYLALAGDTSDNIPGVPGIGPKTAVKLLEQWHSFDGIIEHAAEIGGVTGKKILENIELARLSQKLVTICRDVPLTLELDALRLKPFDPEKLAPVLRKYEMTSIANRLHISLTQSTSTALTDDLPLFAQATEPQTQFASVPVSDTPVEAITYHTVADTPHTYTLADSPEKVAELVAALKAAPRFAFDTETTGLSPRHDHAVGCSFTTEPGRAWYVPFPEEDGDVPAALEPFRSVLEDPSKIVVGHNLKFDRAVLRHYGFDIAGTVRDTLLAHYLLDVSDRHSMDHVSRIFLNYVPIPITTLLGEKKDGNMADHTPQEICDYAAEDADVTFRLDDALRPKIAEMGLTRLLEQCEEPLQEVLLDMEETGVKIDTSALRTFSHELDREILKLELAIRETTGGGVNIASPKQLGEVLFEQLHLDPLMKRTARGSYPTNEEVLMRLRERHPIIDQILDYRACVKLKTTYVDKLPLCIDPETGRIHTTFNQAFTETGRLSSSDPNLQNIPIRSDRGQRIRAAFVPSDDDHVLLSADYSQVELRIMAALSQDPAMIDAFARNADIHAETAARVYNIPVEQVTPQQRSSCKMVNFGIIYGISSFGLSQRLRIPRREAAQLIDTYFEQYPGIKTFMDTLIQKAREHGYAETLLGRRRPLPDLDSRNATTRNAAERIAVNMPIQGTAADIIKLAMLRVHQELKQRNLKSKLLLQIHDELLLDVPRDEVTAVTELVRQAMTLSLDQWLVQAPFPVTLEVSIGTGATWLDAH